MEERERTRKEVNNFFRINAFTLKREALDFSTGILADFDKEKRRKWLEKLLDSIRKQSLPNCVIDLNVMKDAASEVSTTRQDNVPLLHVFSAFSVPRWNVTSDGSRILAAPLGPTPEDACVSQLTHCLRQRLLLVLQRARRSRLLASEVVVPVEALLNGASRPGITVLGVLSKITTEGFHIEDLTGSLPLEFGKKISFGEGVFTEGGCMLFKGDWDGTVVFVKEVSLVEPEPAEETRAVLGTANWFGGSERAAFAVCNRLRALEAKRQEATIAILSDVHLDDAKTMEAVYHLLSGFSSCPPLAIIFCGDFCSSPLQPQTDRVLQKGFAHLAAQLREFRTPFASTQFIIVPGSSDPSVPHILPRPPLPPSLTGQLAAMSNVTLATNPARIQYATQEIVVFRADTVERLCREAIHVPPATQLTDQVAATILSNAHLSPLPQWAYPVLWPADVALRLHPLPDVLILADRFKAYQRRIAGCCVANPGSFGPSAFDFFLYDASRRTMEESRIN